MELNAQFKEFLNAIRPTDLQKESWKSGASTLRARLAADIDLSPIVVTTFLQGSVRRSTAIRPMGEKRPDVDVVVVTTIDYSNTSPEEAMSKFVPFLDKHYEGKWKWQGRSFGIELSYVDLDLVITALPSDPKSRQVMERLYRSNSVSSNLSIEDDTSWRLNPSWTPSSGIVSGLGLGTSSPLQDSPQSEWSPHPLFLPDRDVGNWGRTHPLAQIQWTAAKNRSCNGHYVNLVRSMKWWRQTNADSVPKYPKGYPLEHMIGHILPNATESMASGLVQIFEGIRDEWRTYALLQSVPVLPDHGVPEHNVLKRLAAEDFAAFHAAASKTAAKAREALECIDAQESGKLWQGLLGSKFPLPGPQGGDRARLFATPTSSAEPKRTDRFA